MNTKSLSWRPIHLTLSEQGAAWNHSDWFHPKAIATHSRCRQRKLTIRSIPSSLCLQASFLRSTQWHEFREYAHSICTSMGKSYSSDAMARMLQRLSKKAKNLEGNCHQCQRMVKLHSCIDTRKVYWIYASGLATCTIPKPCNQDSRGKQKC